MGLKPFQKQLGNVNLCNFFFSDFLHKDGSVSVPFLSVHAVEMIDSLAENFKIKLCDFCIHTTNMHL